MWWWWWWLWWWLFVSTWEVQFKRVKCHTANCHHGRETVFWISCRSVRFNSATVQKRRVVFQFIFSESDIWSAGSRLHENTPLSMPLCLSSVPRYSKQLASNVRLDVLCLEFWMLTSLTNITSFYHFLRRRFIDYDHAEWPLCSSMVF